LSYYRANGENSPVFFGKKLKTGKVPTRGQQYLAELLCYAPRQRRHQSADEINAGYHG